MRAILAGVLVFVIAIGAAADEPKTDKASRKAIDQALEAFAGAWEIVAADPAGATKRRGPWSSTGT